MTKENQAATYTSKKGQENFDIPLIVPPEGYEAEAAEMVNQIPEYEIDGEVSWKDFEKEHKIRKYSLRELIHVHEDTAHIPDEDIPFSARGKKASLLHGALPETFGPRREDRNYLKDLITLTGGPDGPIGLQFVAQPDKENPVVPDEHLVSAPDSLIEDHHEAVPGLIHKYPDRVLILLTGICEAYCRYCTRGRLVGIEKPKKIPDIDKIFEYIAKHNAEVDEKNGGIKIQELIFSGGDPFTLPEGLFSYVIDKLVELEEADLIDSVRFGTRSPIHTGKVEERILKELERLRYSPHVMLHINHPYEITQELVTAMDQLRRHNARLYSQSVMVAGVNDNREILKTLAVKLDKYGVFPYYVFDGDKTPWTEHQRIPVQTLMEISSKLRAELPGVAGTARYVIDVPGGHGKITLPEGFWHSKTSFEDFKGKLFEIDEHGNILPAQAKISHLERNSLHEFENGNGEVQIFNGGHNFD